MANEMTDDEYRCFYTTMYGITEAVMNDMVDDFDGWETLCGAGELHGRVEAQLVDYVILDKVSNYWVFGIPYRNVRTMHEAFMEVLEHEH